MKKLLYTIAFVIPFVGCDSSDQKTWQHYIGEKKRLAQLYYCAEECGKWDSAYYYYDEFQKAFDSARKYHFLVYPEDENNMIRTFIDKEKCSNCDTTEPRIDIIPIETK